MPDICDLASESEAQHLASALSAATAILGRGPVWVGEVPHCRACGEEIAVARIKALPNTELCIECALDAEK